MYIKLIIHQNAKRVVCVHNLKQPRWDHRQIIYFNQFNPNVFQLDFKLERHLSRRNNTFFLRQFFPSNHARSAVIRKPAESKLLNQSRSVD